MHAAPWIFSMAVFISFDLFCLFLSVSIRFYLYLSASISFICFYICFYVFLFVFICFYLFHLFGLVIPECTSVMSTALLC